VLLLDEGRRTSVIILRLRLVNLSSRGRWRGGDRRRWRGGVTARAERGFRRFAGRGSSSLVSQALWLSSVFTEWWVSLLISVCMSWCPRFSIAGLPPSAGSAGAGEREARGAWRYSSLIGVAECLRRTSRCASLKGWGEDAVRDVFRQQPVPQDFQNGGTHEATSYL